MIKIGIEDIQYKGEEYMMKLSYKPSGVCVKEIKLEVEDNILKSVDFEGGCPGNLALLKKLIEGKDIAFIRYVDDINYNL